MTGAVTGGGAYGDRLFVRVLLDTGPTDAELALIGDLFATVGMESLAEGHSYGGPPPTSAFMMVVSSALGSFLDRFAVPTDEAPGWPALRELVSQLQGLRADPERWGRPHGVMLEDSHSGHSVHLPPGLSDAAYEALMHVDLSDLDPDGVPTRLEWSVALHRWQVCLTTASRRYARRAPHRAPDVDSPRVQELTETDTARLWRLAGRPDLSVVAWQRIQIVLASAVGRNVPSIARQQVTSEHRVRAVIRSFNRDGFDSLELGYTGREPAVPSTVEERDARAVAARPPADFGLPDQTWDARLLAEFLVSEGVVEDLDLDWVDELVK